MKNRKPEPCTSVVVIVKTADGEPGAYVLVTAFVGGKPEPEPWDGRAIAAAGLLGPGMRRALDFWGSHALVWGSEPVIPGTETEDCPW